jgi:hypothetical protein
LHISQLSPVSKHDSPLFKPALVQMMATLKALNIEVPPGTPLNLDPGFDSKSNENICLAFDLKPNIKCNPRNTKKEAVAPDMQTYKQRYVNERAFAWEDTYRRLVTRYEVYARNHLAFTYMAAALTLLRLIT